MHSYVEEIVERDIAPLVMQGDVNLFIGAGFSQGTTNIDKSTIPSSAELIARIIKETGFNDLDPNDVSLKEAFSLGKKTIEDFDGFLDKNFRCDIAHRWQSLLFRHWWKHIFTTNIDTVIESAIDSNKRNDIHFPEFSIYNYCDIYPLNNNYLSPPIVKLHGCINHLSDGVIFDGAQYSDHIIKSPDWLRMAAINLSHSACLLLAFNFDEPDIDIEIERRKQWCDTDSTSIWMVKRSFKPIEKRLLPTKGIIPLEADVKDFSIYLDQHLTVLSPSKYVKRKYPHLKNKDLASEAVVYFTQEFDHIPTEIQRRSSAQIVDSRFLSGDFPDWYYISKRVPAEFDYLVDLKYHYEKLLKRDSDSNVKGIIITGPTASGKTTLCRQFLRDITEQEKTTYEFVSQRGLDNHKTFDAIKEIKGNIILYFNSTVDQFYAINELIKQYLDRGINGNLIIIIEEKTINWNRDKHHLSFFINNESDVINYQLPPLSSSNAAKLLQCLKNVGMAGNILNDKLESDAIKVICDKEKGYKGDLLATLCDIITGHSFAHYIKEEYEEIVSPLAKKIYTLLSIVTSVNLSTPVRYIAEIFNLKIGPTFDLLTNDLEDKLYWDRNREEISSRHPVIAVNFLNQLDDYEIKKDLIVSLMSCLSAKFDIHNIKKHPAPFRIYKKLISQQYLRDILFKNHLSSVEEIYIHCQHLFPEDGIYWIQYGRYLHVEKKYDEAIHCYRKGTEIYDHFHGRHALGHCLLQRYHQGGCKVLPDYEEGVSLLQAEISARGAQDPYPYTTLASCLLNIFDISGEKEIISFAKEIINDGLLYHRTNTSFQNVVKRYYSNPTYSAFI